MCREDVLACDGLRRCDRESPRGIDRRPFLFRSGRGLKNGARSQDTAGAVPGVLVGVGLMIICYFLAKKRHYPVCSEGFSVRNVLRSFKGAVLGIIAMAIILGGILTGMFTPTEGGRLQRRTF